MNCQRNTCIWLSVIIGIVVGVLFGILYSQGIFPIGIVFWLYLAVGILGLLLCPLYAARGHQGCFCHYKALILTAIIGTIISSTVGQILFFTSSTTALAISLSISTFFIFMQSVSLIFLTNFHCNNRTTRCSEIRMIP